MFLYEVLSKNTKLANDVMTDSIGPLTSGLKSFDDVTGGFQSGDIIILTSIDPILRAAFINKVALNNSAYHRIPSVIFCSEMNAVDAAKQIMLSIDDFQVIPKNTPLYLEETGNSSVSELKDRITKLRESSLIEIVIINSIDYAYKHLPVDKGERITGLFNFIRELRILAKKLKLVMILTASAVKDFELPKEIAISEPLADWLIEFGMMESSDDRDKRMITVNKNGNNIATLEAMFNRKRNRFYDVGENDEPPVLKKECKL